MKLILKFLISFALISVVVSPIYAQPPIIIWSDPVDTADIALSKDGQYVASISFPFGPQIRFYSRSSGTPLWTRAFQEGLYSVAISAYGDCVVIGSESRIYFWKNARSLTGTPDPTWESVPLGPIERRCLDISDDGDYVVACGTGQDVFYWAGAKGKSGINVPTTWDRTIGNDVRTVDMSSDGDYVAAGVDTDVAYWKNARSLTGSPTLDWKSAYPGDNIVDVAISDDGSYVAAAGELGPSPVYYWSNAKSLSGNPSTTWESASGVDFSSIDMSSDGDSVIAGAIGPDPEDRGVYFWSSARGKSGTPNPTWKFTTTGEVHDVTINVKGDYMAAVNDIIGPHYVYFFNSAGTVLWNYEPDNPSFSTSISGDGRTLAVGTIAPATNYLFDTGYSSPENPVGGYFVHVNKIGILTPYIALVGLIGAISTIFATRRWRKD
jgi:hypothetical protein